MPRTQFHAPPAQARANGPLLFHSGLQAPLLARGGLAKLNARRRQRRRAEERPHGPPEGSQRAGQLPCLTRGRRSRARPAARAAPAIPGPARPSPPARASHSRFAICLAWPFAAGSAASSVPSRPAWTIPPVPRSLPSQRLQPGRPQASQGSRGNHHVAQFRAPPPDSNSSTWYGALQLHHTTCLTPAYSSPDRRERFDPPSAAAAV